MKGLGIDHKSDVLYIPEVKCCSIQLASAHADGTSTVTAVNIQWCGHAVIPTSVENSVHMLNSLVFSVIGMHGSQTL